MYLSTASEPVILDMIKTPVDVDKYIYVSELVLAVFGMRQISFN